jgi:Fe-S-cluster containining protein
VSRWWEEKGVRFECQGSGRCCVSRGQYGFVYLTPDDRRQMARVLKMRTAAFTRKFCKKTDGVWHLKDGDGPECLFLKDGNRCSVYEGRPQQCRTWPFWPEVMNAKSWKKEVATYCPGIGKGRLYSGEEIQAILDSQSSWTDDLAKSR